MKGREEQLPDSVAAEISYLFWVAHKPCAFIAKFLNLKERRVYTFINSGKNKRYKKSKRFITEIGPIPAVCPVCRCTRYVEPVISDGDEGKQFVLPIDTGIFDIVCYMGHRYQYDWTGHLAQKERKDDSTKEERGDNAMLSIRREETVEVDNTLDNTAKAGRSQMSRSYRRSWRSTAAKLRAERDNLSSTYQQIVVRDESTSGD